MTWWPRVVVTLALTLPSALLLQVTRPRHANAQERVITFSWFSQQIPGGKTLVQDSYRAANSFFVYTVPQIDTKLTTEHDQVAANLIDLRKEVLGVVNAAFAGMQQQALSPEFQGKLADTVATLVQTRLEATLTKRDSDLRASIMSDVRKLLDEGGRLQR